MTKLQIGCLTLPFLLCSQNVMAESNVTTTGELMNYCMAADNIQVNFGSGYCMGNISGALLMSTSHQVYMSNEYGFKPTLCIPENWTIGQGIKVFLKWANNHPERLHEPDYAGVYASHLDAFRCK